MGKAYRFQCCAWAVWQWQFMVGLLLLCGPCVKNRNKRDNTPEKQQTKYVSQSAVQADKRKQIEHHDRPWRPWASATALSLGIDAGPRLHRSYTHAFACRWCLCLTCVCGRHCTITHMYVVNIYMIT